MACEKIRTKATTTTENKLSKNKEEEDEIQRKLIEANEEWCDCKFQIQWNKLEWVNPRSLKERKNTFCASLKNIYF